MDFGAVKFICFFFTMQRLHESLQKYVGKRECVSAES